MAVTAAMVKELREMTGAGMMDCKKALAATDGDMDKAVEFLREKGLAGAEKKAGRIAAEGIVATAMTDDEKKAVVVEVNAETDFVAKNAKFQAYVAQVAAQALTTTAADMDSFMAEKWAADETCSAILCIRILWHCFQRSLRLIRIKKYIVSCLREMLSVQLTQNHSVVLRRGAG